jgi:hypothetical protein
VKVLITGGKSSPSYKIVKAFQNDQVLLADYGDIPAFSAGQYQFITLGEKNEETIAHNLLNACLDHGVEMILPLHEFEVAAVAKASLLFSEFGIQVLLPELTELPKYFHSQEDVAKGQNWAIFINGELLYSPAPDTLIEETGRSKNLNGVFYIPEDLQSLTAILFTIS